MTQVWLKSTSLGRLDIVEIFDYMDGPKLFACLSEFQRLYLIIWFGEEGRYRRFLGVAVSESRYQMIRSGGIPLAIAFREPESGVVFRFSFTAGQEPQIEPLLAEQISPALLPDGDDVLSLPTETISPRMKDLALAQKAISTRRETLEVHLDFESWYREEAPVKGLGRLLTCTQELIDSLGQRLGGVATMRGAIPPDILFATEARVVQAGGGSFGLEISASQISGLYGESLIGRSMRRLVDLLKLGDDAAALREALIDIKPRAVSKFREFLTVVVDNKITFATTFASPDSVNNASVALPLSRAAAALLIAEQVNKEGTRPILGLGVFDAVDIPRKSFGVVLGQQTYRGRILDQALPDARNVTIGNPYYFRLLESLEVSSSGEEKLKYELEMISTEPLVIPE